MAARRELVPADPALTTLDKSSLNHRTIEDQAAGIGRRVRPTQTLLNIFSALATGHLPWGVAWPSGLTREGNGWTLCCGHTLGFAKAQELVAAGLLREVLGDGAPDRLIITEAGGTWLAQNWPS